MFLSSKITMRFGAILLKIKVVKITLVVGQQ